MSQSDAAAAPGDLSALIAHISSVPDDLAEAWARALDSDAVQRGIAQLEQRVTSFATAYVGETSRLEGLHDTPTLLSGLPLPDSALSELPHSDPRIHWANAETTVVSKLTESLKWLREPTLVVLRLPEGTEESLWDTGVFVQFRDQLALLSRVHEARLEKDGVPGRLPTWIDFLQCAHRAHSAGLAEAVCLYLRLAWPGMEEALALASRGEQRVPESEGPTGLEGEAAPTEDGVPLVGEEFVAVREAVGLLLQMVETWSAGDTLDLGTTVLLADGLLRRADAAVSSRLFGMRPPSLDTELTSSSAGDPVDDDEDSVDR